jgi:pimeloyl-ACP methyl ester carboxylesterase
MIDAPLSAPGLRPALDSEQTWLDGIAGRVAVYRRAPEAPAPGGGARRPIVLVHTVNAAGSAAEVRPVFERLGRERPTYALDLPGFGLSARGPRAYTPRLMTDAVHDVAAYASRREGAPSVHLFGASLGTEYVVRAAVEAPVRTRSVSLVSPTGFMGRRRFDGPEASTRASALARALLVDRPWSGAAFRALTRPSVIRYFLERTWGAKGIDEALWRYDVETTRVPGAEHAPLAFLSFALFSADISRLHDALPGPTWVAHGARGDFTDYRGLARYAGSPRWRIDRFETGALPYFEAPEPFFAALEAHLARAEG